METVWPLQIRCRAPESPVFKPTLTVRPDSLVFGEVQQWRAKTAENKGDRRGPFRLFLWAFAGKSVANPLQATPNPLQIRCSARRPPSMAILPVERSSGRALCDDAVS
jgi:hypothetical protein